MKKLFFLMFGLLLSSSAIFAEEVSMDELLKQIKSGRSNDSQLFREREERFKKNLSQRSEMLAQIKKERVIEEKRSEQLEASYKNNEVELKKLRAKLSEEMGDLKELFGVIQQTAGEAAADFSTSITSSQFPGRSKKLREMAKKMSQSDELISIHDIESMWFELQREMIEQGKVSAFTTSVSATSGEKKERKLTRIGVFNLVSDGQFIHYEENSGLSVLARQPQNRYQKQAKEIELASAGDVVSFPLDPTQGKLLEALVESPNLMERVEQGGVVGYIIIVMGMVAFIVAFFKITTLIVVGRKVSVQIKDLTKPSEKNPLGRIIKTFHEHKTADAESMELRLGEAIMKETPKLNAWLMLLKIVAVVAPLMGLLGTVTGMIQTFQSITLFGSGDPKLMAGGISQALVTTVLGLCVAIPAVLLHTAASTRAKRIQEVLEEQSVGMVAEQSENDQR